MKITKLLKILLALTFLKGLIWAYLIPPFQSPDEQNHFAYVQVYAQTGERPDVMKTMSISSELVLTTRILGFDWNGNHPMWNKDIFNNAKNIEKDIRNISEVNRNIFISFSNGLKNPPVYYFLSAIFYKIASFGSIFERLFAVRVLSIIFAVITVYLSYKTAMLITGKENLSITVTSLISMNPSFTNITATVTNDSMAIAVVSLSIYAILNAAYQKTISSDIKNLLGGFLALTTRVHLGVLLLYSLYQFLFRKMKKKIFIFVIPAAIFFFAAPQRLPYLPLGLDKFVNVVGNARNILFSSKFFPELILFLKSAIPHYFNEVFPWYFGVFGWLEVTLPPLCYTIIKVLILFSFLGFLIKRKNPYKSITPGAISAIILFLVLFIFDFITFVSSGSGVGVQGRHLLPGISIHMILLVIGLELFLPKKFVNFERKCLIIFMVLVNLTSFYVILDYFYSVNISLLNRILFFKPDFINGAEFLILVCIYIAFLLNFLLNVSKLKEDE